MDKNHKSKSFKRRLFAMASLSVLLAAVFLVRLVQWQIIDGESYYAQAVSTVSYTFNIPAARGEIVDRYGRVIATNQTVTNVVVNRLFLPDSELNDTLLALVNVLEAHGEEWIDNTPITDTIPYQFTGANEDGTDGSAANAMKSAFGKQNYATADQVAEAAIEQYSLSGYSQREQRILLGIRYEMQRVGYSSAVPYTFAEDVGEVTRAVLAENAMGLSGIELQEGTRRVYPEGGALPHVLGIIGLISEEEWAAGDHALREAGYAMNDYIGKFGLEQAFESELRGEDGEMQIVRASDGALISSEVTREPRPGQTVVLSVDLEFQYQLQALLEEYVLSLRENSSNAGGDAEGGALVVLDPNTGGVLGYANYPSYDINDYYSSYAEMVSAEYNPMYNRAFMELYRPGSTFKPAVALAGLMSGEVTASTTINCGGIYTYYAPAYTPRCLGTHGNIAVRDALKHSCNIYFYELGRRLGVEGYNPYAYALGLGLAVGVEVTELAGYLSSPETSELLGGEWSNANSSQAAIGQLDTMVTPVQLATYAATLANDGIRYRTRLVNSLRDTNTGQDTTVYGAEVEQQLDDNEAFQIVREGMVAAAQEGSTTRAYLGAANGYNIAAKTGSPQQGDSTNSVIVAYGPADDADIAVAVVIEKGINGYRSAALVEQVFDAYYSLTTGSLAPLQENQLLA